MPDDGSVYVEPSVKAVRGKMPPEHRCRSTAKGLSLCALATAVYIASFACILLAPGWPLKILSALINHFAIDVLFVLGHDACHGSLTSSAFGNRLLGRLCFLPSLHPYTSWEYSHNALHHGWTNVYGKDPVFAPLSFAQFQRLPKWRKAVERMYRSALGLWLYYLVEIWWKYEIFPRPTHRRKTRRFGFELDRLLVLGFVIAQCAGVFWYAVHHHTNPFLLVLVAFALPFLLFDAAMGFVIHQHHTHPRVPWYATEQDWSFFRGQVEAVVHVEFPRIVDVVLHHIMDHTAHHVDPKIPLYNLCNAQRALEEAYGSQIISLKWTLREFRRTLATCRLFDYDHHRWLDYDGNPTSPSLVSQAVCSRYRIEGAEVGGH